MRPDPDRETIGSLGVIREMLDHASDVDQAVAILDQFNVDFGGGPPLHYLIADRSGRAVLVEFYDGQRHLYWNEVPWHLATNFLRAMVSDPDGGCWRYDTLREGLESAGGRLAPSQAMDLLGAVAQEGTQWSVVYGISSGQVSVAMGRAYQDVHTFDRARARK